MDRNAIVVMDWMGLVLLVPATIILVWKLVSDKIKMKNFSSDLKTSTLLLGLAVLGVTQLNVSGLPGWGLFMVQLLILIVLYKRLWSPFMRKLRGETD